MSERQSISDVFKALGQPDVTYVKRDDGRLEKQLASAISEKGQLCLVTGPSKTGKTTLYKEVLGTRREVPLVVQCDKSLKIQEIWRRALEAVDFDRVEARSSTVTTTIGTEGEISGKLSWAWLAEMATRIKGTLSSANSNADVRKTVLSEPGPDLLIPILQHTRYRLVVEDFHYLEDSEKELLFQQWKRFTDNDVSVLVLGTTHRAVDIANSNKDLLGRIAQIDVGHWQTKDLESICRQGFDYLKLTIPDAIMGMIAAESVGLPILVQQACLGIFTGQGLEYVDEIRKNKKIKIDQQTISVCLHNIAKTKYTQFESYYNTLIRGPREKARKYKTYELVIACYTLNPIKFKLSRTEIDARLNELDIKSSEIPPLPP